MEQDKELILEDLWMSGFLSLKLGIDPDIRAKNGKALFYFPSTAVIHEAISVFNSGGAIVAADYAREVKRLRTLLYQVKRRV